VTEVLKDIIKITKKSLKINRSNRSHHNILDSEWYCCKNYFDFSCAYCGMSYSLHREMHNQDLHKDHFEPQGGNKLDNCVPACKSCNTSKNYFDFYKWYPNRCEGYTKEREQKILRWINKDYKLFIK